MGAWAEGQTVGNLSGVFLFFAGFAYGNYCPFCFSAIVSFVNQ
jgi:hypothetical protein